MTEEVKKLNKAGEYKPKRDKRGRLLPGSTGNPKGKPKGSFSLVSILKRELQKCPKEQDKKTYADLLITRMLKEAIENGSDAQIKNILNYIEGMPKQSLDFGLQDSINEVEIKIKNETSIRGEQKHNEDICEESDGVSEQEEQIDNQSRGDGIKQDGELGSVDGNNNDQGKERSDNDSEKDSSGSKGDLNA